MPARWIPLNQQQIILPKSVVNRPFLRLYDYRHFLENYGLHTEF